MRKLLIVNTILIALFAAPILVIAAAFPPALGGTGTSQVPVYGQVLVDIGNSGVYTPTATSSLGVSAASSTLLSDNNTFSGNNIFTQISRFSNGFLSTASSTVTGTLTLATTTTGSLNGIITVTGWPYAKSGAGIQQAVDICSALGSSSCGGVLASAGSYSASSEILLPSNVQLYCADRDATIITGTGNFPTIGTTASGGTSKTTYSNIGLHNCTIKNSGTSVGSYITAFKNVNGLVIDNSRFEHAITPISGTPEALYIEYARNVRITGNYLFNLAGDGIQLNGVDYFTVASNNISSSTDDAIDIDSDFIDTASVPSRYGTVIGNEINGVLNGNGIRIEDSSYVSVTGNQVTNVNAGSCIEVNYVNVPMIGNTISGNQVTQCHINGILNVGPNLLATTITGNTVTSSADNSGSNVRAGIQINAASTTVTGNSIYDIGKNGGDGGGIVDFKVNDVLIANNFIASTTNGINFWNGSGSVTYTGVTATNNQFSQVISNFRNDSAVLSQPGIFYSGVVNGNYGISTTTPGSLLSIGGIANLSVATSSFYSTGGINLAAGCFAVLGNCLSFSSLAGSINLTSQVTGILPIANGGTATSTQVTNGVNYFDGTRITSQSLLVTDGTKLGVGVSLPSTSGDIAATRIVNDTFTSRTSGFLNFVQPFSSSQSSGTSTIAVGQGFTVGSSQLVVQQGSGFVGVGITAPEYPLNVVNTASGLNFAEKIENKFNDGSDQGTGILFRIDGTEANRGKGALVYDSPSASWNRGDFYFLQNSTADTSLPTLSNAVMIIKNNGNIGLGTTTPTATLTVQLASSTLASASAFDVWGLMNTIIWLFERIDLWGHLITSGPAPSVSGGTSSVAGNDRNGNITVTGTLLTSVTLTFAHAYATAPDCTIADSSTGVTGAITSISTSQIVIGFSAGINSGTVWYICQQHQ